MQGKFLNEQQNHESQSEREHKALWLWTRALGADAHEADDIAQEALIIWARRGGQSWPGAQSGVFLRTTASKLLKATRRKAARRDLILRERAASAIHERMIGSDPTPAQEALRLCLSTLPVQQRQALEATYSDGKSGAEVGAMLGLEAPQVHHLLSQARLALRNCIEGKLAEGE